MESNADLFLPVAWSLTGTIGVFISIYIVDRVGRRLLLSKSFPQIKHRLPYTGPCR